MVGSGAARGVVLVVEDEQTIADLLLRYLHREGYEVHHETCMGLHLGGGYPHG